MGRAGRFQPLVNRRLFVTRARLQTLEARRQETSGQRVEAARKRRGLEILKEKAASRVVQKERRTEETVLDEATMRTGLRARASLLAP